ncbi:MAG: lysophospholipid acyltransferase family protein [Polyangia bacterium]
MPARDFGSRLGVRVFCRLLGLLPRRLVYALALLPVCWYVLTRPDVRRASKSYRARLESGRVKPSPLLFALRQAAAYSRAILDNIYLGTFGPQRFDIDFTGTRRLRAALDRNRGLVLLSAHAGNWHLAVNFLGRTGARAHLVTDEVRSAEVRWAMDAAKRRAAHLDVHDARSGPGLALELKLALQRGETVILAGDRPWKGARSLEVDLLGSPVRVPALPFALARSSGAPLCLGLAFSTGMQSYRTVAIGPLGDDIAPDSRDGDQITARRFARALSEQIRLRPEQWYNFYDFWGDTARS